MYPSVTLLGGGAPFPLPSTTSDGRNVGCIGRDIGDGGAVVGSGQGGAVLCNRTHVTLLNEVIPTSPAIHLLSAESINRDGQIVARGRLGGINGTPTVFVLTPAR
jgi:hypothetical protein